jgi:flagellar protein FliO/FliZ
MIESLFGTEMPLAIQFCFAFLIMLGLIGATAWAVSRFSARRLGGGGSRGRQSRLSIVDYASVDRSRRLILIRRDNVEHLLLIGGPADVVIEPNIMGAVAGLREVAVTHSSAAALPPPRANPLLDTGSRPRQPELATIPRPAQQIAPMPEAPVALPLLSQAKTSTLPKPDTLAALADNLSNRPPLPRKSPTIVTRTHTIELPPELPPEPRVEPQPEPGIVSPQPAGRPATVETASTRDEELADLARQLEAALRKPSATAARPSASTARAAPVPALEQAPAAEAVPTPPSPMRALRPQTDARLFATQARAVPEQATVQTEAVTIPPTPVRAPSPRADTRPPTTPTRAALSPEQAPAAEALPTPTSPGRVPRPGEPKPARSVTKPYQSKTPFDNLEQELASLLGRPTEN